MKSRFFFVFDFSKLLRLVILTLLILVVTCSCIKKSVFEEMNRCPEIEQTNIVDVSKVYL